ncbi:hypothetical protein [Methylovulum psychrotolerans]|nr:hypothetical protein [Methylovulum psychrotolerans]
MTKLGAAQPNPARTGILYAYPNDPAIIVNQTLKTLLILQTLL